MAKGTRILINIKKMKWGKIHHCALCATAMDARCRKERHFDYCEECGHIFSVLKGCHYHPYNRDHNREMLKEKRRFAGYTLNSEDEENPLVIEYESSEDSWEGLEPDEMAEKYNAQFERDREAKVERSMMKRKMDDVDDEDKAVDDEEDDADAGKKGGKKGGRKAPAKKGGKQGGKKGKK